MGSVCPSRRGPWTQGPPVVGRTWYGLACARCCWAEQRVVMFHVVGSAIRHTRNICGIGYVCGAPAPALPASFFVSPPADLQFSLSCERGSATQPLGCATAIVGVQQPRRPSIGRQCRASSHSTG